MADPNTQALTMANLVVASRLPAEGDFRRNALLGAMIGQVNPMAGVVVAIRSADAISTLISERDAARAQAASGGGTAGGATTGGGTTTTGGGLAATSAASPSEFLRSVAAAATGATPQPQPQPQPQPPLPAPAPSSAAAAAGAGAVTAEQVKALISAFTEGAQALTKLAAEAAAAVKNQEENQAALTKVLERMGAAPAPTGDTSQSGKSPASSTTPGKGGGPA